MKQTLITYKTWRTSHNPWEGNNFIGNLNPNNPDDANLIDEIHSYIDEYFNPRILGVSNPDRFLILMHAKLASIESNFFRSFMLDKNYDDILDMLKNIDMLSDTNTDTNLSGTNNGTITAKRTDNLTTTKSEREDTRTDTTNTTDTQGARSDTRDTTNGGTITKDTNYGRKDTQSGTDTTTRTGTDTSKGRGVNSQTPQSNVGMNVVGIDADLDWNYASAMQDTSQSINRNETTTINHGLTDTLSGTDTEKTTDARTVMETLDTGEQINKSTGTLNSTFNEGEQSVTNTGTQDNTSTEDRTHSQTGKYKKVNDNSGRTDNIAILRQQWRELLHKTMSAYSYLFEQLDTLFISIWDIDTDCHFEII